MKIHRFIIPSINLQAGRSVHIDDKRVVHQAGRVLRLRPGDAVAIGNGSNQEGLVKIISIDHKSIKGLTEKVDALNHFLRETVLYCALIKKDNFELVAQKATETGVSAIVPLISARVIKKGMKYDRVRNIILEASEQSGRGDVPKLHEQVDFSEGILHAAKNNEHNIFFTGKGRKLDVDGLNPGRIGFFIGPEGGWDDLEHKTAKDTGFIISSLSTLTLRAETAAIAASYIVTNK